MNTNTHTTRCVVCNAYCDKSGLCDEHKYDEQDTHTSDTPIEGNTDGYCTCKCHTDTKSIMDSLIACGVPKVQEIRGKQYPIVPYIEMAHWVESYAERRAATRAIEEHEQSLANFQPEYSVLVRKTEHLTEVGEAHLKQLKDRYTYHKNRIAELKASLTKEQHDD